jgi:hypothetical protein
MTRTVRCIEALCLGLFLILVCDSSIADSRNTIFKSPKSFKKLPKDVASALEKKGCRIPQATVDGSNVGTNIISGEFAQKGQKDWAMLCIINGSLSIRVFWGGAIRCPSKIELPMVFSEKEIANGLDFDYSIGAANKDSILQDFEAYGGPTPPTIAHLGIAYGSEKASVVYFCHDRKWIELTGAD